tara:strand:+ start:137 stop:670 length:534 start_codon:yes stop_codon:yes gene_type:complete
MKNNTLSPVAAWILLTLVMLIGTFLFIMPLIDLHQNRDTRLIKLLRSLETQMAIVARGPALEARQATIKVANGSLPIAPKGFVSDLALQELLREEASLADTVVHTLQSLTPLETSPFRTVRIRADISGTMSEIQRLLHGIESRAPVVKIESIEVRPQSGTKKLEAVLDLAALKWGQT